MNPALAVTRAQLLGWIAAAAIASMVLAGGLGALAGYRYGTAAGDRRVAQLERNYAREQAATAVAEADRIKTAQARADELTNQLAAARDAATSIQEKLDAELRRKTSGRPCLGSAALRVLDRAPGIAVAPDLPAAARGAAAAHAEDPAADAAPAADDGTYASDTDVALWGRHAAGQYAECVRRLDALIDFDTRPQGAGQ